MNCLILAVIYVSLVLASPFEKRSIGPANNSARIIGGRPARAGQFPYIAAITVKTEEGTFFCGGALLNIRWILTAGHCVARAIQFTIALGSNELTENDPNRVMVVTSEYILHPSFDRDTLDNDIGLIRLRQDVQYSDYISWIYMPTTDVLTNTNVTTAGWGQTSDHDPTMAHYLNNVALTTLSNEECKVFYGDQITNHMVCVGGNYNEGMCTGDSGSPLVYYLNNRHQTHVAVASFISANGCESTAPSGYTRTYPYREWILNVTDNLYPRP